MDFTIVKHTARLINNAVKMDLFGKADDPRFFGELKSLLTEENAIPAIKRIEELGLFPFLWPDLKPHLKIDRRFHHCLTQAQRAVSWFKLLYLSESFEPWMVYLLAIMGRSPVTVLINFCNRFQLSQKQTEYIVHEKSYGDKTAAFLSRRDNLKNSEIYTVLNELQTEGLLYLMAVGRKSEIKKSVSLFVTSMKHETTLLNGSDLKEMGYQPGPIFKDILHRLFLARLDGDVKTREDEIALVTRSFPLSDHRSPLNRQRDST
jgi:tRNA nucleotidyltransferase (CCA-adding enzyme)